MDKERVMFGSCPPHGDLDSPSRWFSAHIAAILLLGRK